LLKRIAPCQTVGRVMNKLGSSIVEAGALTDAVAKIIDLIHHL
jgi:hypothetical protein